MNGWQRVVLGANATALLAVVVVCFTVVLLSLSESQLTAFGHWVDAHGSGIWTAVTGAVVATAGFFGGNLRGQKTGKQSAAAIAEGQASGDAAAVAIRSTVR